MEPSVHKAAISNVTGMAVGERDSIWVVRDGETWRELSVAEAADVVVEYDRLYKEMMVPKSITMRQFQLSLLDSGITEDMVLAFIANLSSPQKERASIEWKTGSVVDRSNESLMAMVALIGKSDTEVDALFIHGSTL